MNRRQKVVIKAAVKRGVARRLTDPAVRSTLVAFITRIRSSLRRGYVNSDDSEGLYLYIIKQGDDTPELGRIWRAAWRIRLIVAGSPSEGQMKEINAKSKAVIEAWMRTLLEHLRSTNIPS